MVPDRNAKYLSMEYLFMCSYSLVLTYGMSLKLDLHIYNTYLNQLFVKSEVRKYCENHGGSIFYEKRPFDKMFSSIDFS